MIDNRSNFTMEPKSKIVSHYYVKNLLSLLQLIFDSHNCDCVYYRLYPVAAVPSVLQHA